MDRHKSLYKDNCALLSPKLLRLNRERQVIRTKQRNDQFYSTRNISVSPTPQKIRKKQEIEAKEVAVAGVQIAEESKENDLDAANADAVEPANLTNVIQTSRIAKVACKKDGQKWTRQELYLQRFIAWKDAKKAQLEQKKQQRHLEKKPFVPAGGGAKSSTGSAAVGTTIKAVSTTFVPKNHKFTAPEGLKSPVDAAKLTHINKSKQRQSLYTVVPTPEKKNNAPTAEIKKSSIVRKVLLATNVKTPGVLVPNTTSRPNTITTTKTQQHKTPCAPCTNKVNKQLAKTPGATTTLIKKDTEIQRFVKPRPLVLPLPQKPNSAATALKGRARIVKPIRGGGGGVSKNGVANSVAVSGSAKAAVVNGGGAIAKAKASAAAATSLSTKINGIKPINAITKPKLAVTMKAKKIQSSFKKSVAASTGGGGDKKKLPAKFKLNKQALLNIANKDNLPTAETPHELYDNVNPFGMFVTSTKRKSLSNTQSTLDFLTLDTNITDTISPVEPFEKVQHRESAAKRQLIQDSLIGSGKAKEANKFANESLKSKFNFIRYSEVATEIPDDDTAVAVVENEKEKAVIDEMRVEQREEKQLETGEYKENTATSEPVEASNVTTPPRKDYSEENDERPINYLSPFVSVTRGKVNSKMEKEKRNSIYLQNTKTEISDAEALALQQKETENQEALVAMRRTLETVRYFRKQLKDEIERLHAICDKWEAYKTENLTHLQAIGGDDMINVTIGQTKLLTSKKFMQFSGLIDRCERAVTSPHLLVNDGSEDTKPITATDLEGFWCMVGLQVDNVEKRFNNLERWRANNWSDPDEVKSVETKQPKQLGKLKKNKRTSTSNVAVAKSKPVSALQQMLRKMHADIRKNKAAPAATIAAANEIEAEAVLTPTSKSRSNSRLTPQRISSPHRRISIIVKDRKLHSASPTILTINTTNRRTSLRNRANSPQHQQDSPKLVKHVQDFRRSLTNLQKSCGERNELWMTALKGADQQRRKSIMSTPSPLQSTPPAIAKSRKSILKTPGTAKGKPKNVIFNEELRIKKFKFTIDSDQSDEADEEEARRMSASSEKDSETEVELNKVVPDCKRERITTANCNVRSSSVTSNEEFDIWKANETILSKWKLVRQNLAKSIKSLKYQNFNVK